MAFVAVAGSVAQRPHRGGHAWVFLNYLLGLRKLGHEVLFIDRLTSEMVGTDEQDVRRSPQAEWLDQAMATIGFDNDYLLLVDGPANEPARTRDLLLDRLRRTDLLINVNGFLRDGELLEAPEVTAFLDIDPSIQQMWEALELAELFVGHDLHFTVGTNVGRQSCSVPTCGISWIPTFPPVVMEEWPVAGRGQVFTTVASWRGPYGTIEYRGQTYGLRVHEFRGLVDLPLQMEDPVAIALDIDPEDQADSDALANASWQLLDPLEVAGDPTSYREFIQGSKAELSIAKNVYVQSQCGWFSDRSACYLASGKPVLAQDTGYSESLPTDGGLVPFTNLDEAVAGAKEIHQDWPEHSRAAREIAAEHFDSDRVLKRMLNVAGI